MPSIETTVFAGVPGSDPGSERGASGRSQLQERLALHARVLNLVYLAYWPAFVLTWGQEPGVGFARALHHVLSPGTFVLGAIQLAFWLVVRAGIRRPRELRAMDLGVHLLIGTAFAVIVIVHPSPSVAVFEGALALTCVLALRALLVPSTWLRTAGVGVLAALPVVVALLVRAPHLAIGAVAGSTECLLFTSWSVLAIAISSVASGVLYGLRREVRVARRLGQYTLGEKLGEGGMGVVYRAQHAMLKRPTAIKLLSKATSFDSTARFEQEAQLTSQLTHPSAVVVHDYGRTADGVLYYAMEYLDGIDLEQLADLDGPQPAGRVIHLLRQVCGALAEAHGNGLIHRDIKPANLFLLQRSHEPDFVKVLDFGLVKDLGPRGSVGLTGTGMVGTPLYMSPESVAESANVDARSDLYSVGAAAYRLLTGATVFEGRNAVEVWGHTLHSAPVPLRQRRASVPADLEAIVMRCLAKSPADRFATADELIDALDTCEDAWTWTAADARAWWTTHAGALARSRDERHRANTELRPDRRVAAAPRPAPRGRVSGLAGAHV